METAQYLPRSWNSIEESVYGGGGGLYVHDTQEITAVLWLLPVRIETRVGLVTKRPTVKVPVKVQREILYRVSG